MNNSFKRNFSKLFSAYQNLIKVKNFNDDPQQRKLITIFETISLPKMKHKNIFSFFNKTENPLGIYIHGSVGCGKTMIMDLYHSQLENDRALRIHFHEFMIMVHKSLHHVRQNSTKKTTTIFPGASKHTDPLEVVANQIADKYDLILFDEFQVVDVTDAMILKIFFQYLFDRRVFIVATSNRKPEDLYKNGLQRINFLPFIDMIKEKCTVFDMDSRVDYRVKDSIHKQYDKRYFVSNDPNEAITYFHELIGGSKNIVSNSIEVNKRKVDLPNTSNGIVLVSFDDLCSKPLGPADYLALCSKFHTIIIHSIPELNLSNMNETRRFISLVDVVYDQLCCLVIFSFKPVRNIFNIDDQKNQEISMNQRMLFDDLQITSADVKTAILSFQEERFAFSRTLSRLIEMEKPEYWEKTRSKGAITQ